MNVTATEVLGADLLTSRRLHQRRPAQENRALVAHDDGLVAHGRHIGPARGTRAHHHRHLRDALGRHVRLIEEDATEMVAVGKHVVLLREKCPAGVDEVDARQVVLFGDFLRPQVLLDGHRVVGAALHGRVVGDDHALHALHTTDACDDARCGRVAVVHPEGGELPDLQEGRAGIEQLRDAVARQELAARGVFGPRRLPAALGHLRHFRPQVLDQSPHRIHVGAKLRRLRIYLCLQCLHLCLLPTVMRPLATILRSTASSSARY
jgi:hypothetical protein